MNTPNTIDEGGEPSEAARLAWNYCQRVRSGESPCLANYHKRLLTKAAREEFQILISMDAFAEIATDGSNPTVD